MLEKPAHTICPEPITYIVPLSTPLILPEKKVCGSLAACVDVDLMRLHCFRNGEYHLLSEKDYF
jgi:hypothetical protein